MNYLSVAKFSKHQHYKNRRPPWVKFYVELLDPKHPMNALPIPARYLFDRLLLLAANWDNAIPNDFELIAKLTGMESETCRESLAQLEEGRWIKETRTKRRASRTASKKASESLSPEAEAEAETASVKGSSEARPPTAIFNIPITAEKEREVDKILNCVTGADNGSRGVLLTQAKDMPLGKLSKVRESLEHHRGKVGVGYALNALRSEATAA